MSAWFRCLALALLVALWCSGAVAAVPRYDVDAKIDAKAKRLSADVTITLPVEGREASFVLGERFKLRRVEAGPGATHRVEPTDLPFKHLQKVTIAFADASAEPRSIRFRYDGPINAPGQEDVVWNGAMELNFETGWLPFRGDLDLTFVGDFELRGIPSDFVVVAPGTIARDGDRVSVRRAVTDADLPIAAARDLRKGGTARVELYSTTPDGRLEGILARTVEASFDFYVGLFGTRPAGNDPLRVVLLPRSGAAYMRRGFISIADPKDELAKTPDFPEINPAKLVAHEVAHAWWWNGDPISEDIWLIESFAEYSALRYVEQAYGRSDMQALIDRRRARIEAAGPVLGHGRGKRDAIYLKGPVLLLELEARIGRAQMDRFLALLARNPPRVTARVFESLASVVGDEVARDFSARLHADGM